MTPSISFCLRSCISMRRWSIVFLTHSRLMYVCSLCPIRNTRQKACCSDAEFHHGSIIITLDAMVKLRPTVMMLARTREPGVKHAYIHRSEVRLAGYSCSGLAQRRQWPCHGPRSSSCRGTGEAVSACLKGKDVVSRCGRHLSLTCSARQPSF
jgi:hypothetical protein